MSKLQAPVLNGNTLIVNLEDPESICAFALRAKLGQYAVMPAEIGFTIATPVTKELEENYLGMIHGARARAKDKEKPDPKPPTGGGHPDATPPNGGTPGSTSVWEQTYTEARAA